MNPGGYRSAGQRASALLFLLLPLLLALPARAQSANLAALNLARQQLQQRLYQDVVKGLRKTVQPTNTYRSYTLETEARKLLGISHWWLGRLAVKPAERKKQEAEATKHLQRLAGLDYAFRFSQLVHPPALVTFYDRIRSAIRNRGDYQRALEIDIKETKRKLTQTEKALSDARAKLAKQPVIRETIQKKHYFLNFVPFGAGQFQNGHKIKGGLFAAGQGAMAILWLSSFVISHSSLIRNDKNGTVTDDAAGRRRVTQMQQLVVASGSIFLGLVVWGVIDALVFYRRSAVKRTIEQRTPKPAKGRRDEKKTSWQLMPHVVPGGAGLGFGLRF